MEYSDTKAVDMVTTDHLPTNNGTKSDTCLHAFTQNNSMLEVQSGGSAPTGRQAEEAGRFCTTGEKVQESERVRRDERPLKKIRTCATSHSGEM